MDNLKTLMDRKDYELVLKITEESQNPNDLLYRISAFLATNKGERALDCLEANRDLLLKADPMIMRVHVEILCILSRFDEAYKVAKEYSELPYVSQVVEEMLAKLPEYIRLEESKFNKGNGISNEEISKKLKSKNLDDVLIAIDSLRDRDIRLFVNDLQTLMLTYPKQSIRSLALLLLVQKEYGREIKFNHLGSTITVRPIDLEPPFVGESFNDLTKVLDSELKNPTIAQSAVSILSSYIIYTYPKPLNVNYGLLVEVLKEVAFKYLQDDSLKPLEERCKDKGISLEEANKLLKDINEALEDF